VIVSVTPVADPDGRDRNVDWFYKGLENTPAGAAGGGGRGGAGLPYWGKYVYHDNNRDINLSQVSMRALADFYFTAHPPIMHDLHEAQPLLYTYSGGPPQNPNLDPILFTELPFFANFELAQMTKWGMPGVYTHAFMDGWSPGYLGSVAYNHNGMMRMYETQSGTDQAANRVSTQGAPAASGGAAPQNAPAAPGPPAAQGAAAAQGTTAAQGTAAAQGTTVAQGATAAPAATAAQSTPAQGANPAATEGGRGAGRGGRGGRGEGAGAGAGAGRGEGGGGERGGGDGGDGAAFQGRGGGAAGPSTGRGGGQPREWYRGIPIPPGAVANFSRRNNTNYMQTGVLSGLQLTSMIPNLVIENFYKKTMNSIEAGKTDAPFGYVIPPQRDMTRVTTLINLLRVQRIEVGRSTGDIKLTDGTFPAGSYVIKRDQPYGRLAKNLLEKQNYPDPNLRTYDDSGWTMGLASLVEVKEIKDKAVLNTATTPVTEASVKGKVTGNGSAGFAVAHFGSNNMVAFRYKLKSVAMKIADKSFTAEGIEFPAGSFIVSPGSDAAVRGAVEEFGLTAAALASAPSVATHDADVPRVAMFTSWSGTQEIGWVRFTFDKFGIPFDLIYKERVKKGNLRADYDVIVMPTQNLGRTAVFQAPAARPVSYVKSDKYKFLGMYGSSEDITGGFGAEGVEAFQQFLNAGGTLITMGTAVRFPTELGMARTVDASGNTSANFYAPRPIVNAEVLRLDHPVFYGYTDRIMPIKYLGGPLLTVGEADRGNVLARYVGGEASVLSGLMKGADEVRDRPFAVDIPGGYSGKGRVIMFANNPIYRWQNHGEFNMVFNSILNWNDLGTAGRAATPTAPTGGQR
jgi:hypothetical protein